MKQLLAILVVLAICVIGVGFYQGWFTMSNTSTNSATENGDVSIDLSTDKDKFDQDMQTMKDKAAAGLTDDATEASPAPTDDEGNDKLESEKE